VSPAGSPPGWRYHVPLAPLTTLGVGGPARALVEVGNEEQLAQALAEAADRSMPTLVLGGGSNVLIGDSGFDGLVIRMAIGGVDLPGPRASDPIARVGAGEVWDPLVERLVAAGLAGVECLAGIPGSVGATPVQNVGAYGQDVAQVLVSVRAWDCALGALVELAAEDCGLGYRRSVFKRSPRYILTQVRLRLRPGGRSVVAYPELARRLGVDVGEGVDPVDARRAVLDLRRAKGMVLDPADPDTRSVGSFFTNPVIEADRYAALRREHPGLPGFASAEGTKVPAAWLIEHAGFSKGWQAGSAAISGKHPLALTARPGGRAADVVALARRLRDGVEARFGVRLEAEPVLVGVSL
jgi:UDP-N-acetylmuramate dehydrogenase